MTFVLGSVCNAVVNGLQGWGTGDHISHLFHWYDKSHLGKEGFARVHSFRGYSPPRMGKAQQQEQEATVT